MSESIEELEPAEDLQTNVSMGQMLTLAREDRALTVEDVAIRLRLSVHQVRALEADDATALPGSMFVRGFIRNYAKLLGRDADPFLEAYNVSMPESGKLALSLNSANIPIISGGKKVWIPYAIASAMIGLVLGAWMIYMDRVAEDKHAVTEKAVTETQAAPATAATEQVTPMMLQAPPATPGVAETNAVEPAQAKPAAQAPTGAARLNITFTENSWVSVTDHDNKEIFNKNQPAGSQAEVVGTPPFSIVVGNVAGVRLIYNDKPVDLTSYAKANVARLALE